MSRKLRRGSVSVAVTAVLMVNSIALAGPSPAGISALQAEVRNFRTQIDLGKVSAEDAIDSFAKAVAEKDISVADVDAYVKGRLSPREYRGFKAEMDAALVGI